MWEAGTAIGTWILAGITWYLAWETKKAVNRQIEAQGNSQAALLEEQRKAHSVDVMIDFRREWHSSQMVSSRRTFATGFRDHAESIDESSVRVLSFFENLGLFAHYYNLNMEIIWNQYCYYIKIYWVLSEQKIKARRESTKDFTHYDQFQWLYKEVIEIEGKKRGVTVDVARPNTEEINSFIRQEADLPDATNGIA
jgi:hypothetical protein